ncbi:hypothetical protein B0A55_13177, partial [Friedmanniomyces simplex]
MAFYNMDTPGHSVFSLDPKGSDWDNSPPTTAEGWKPFAGAPARDSYQTLSALP